MQIVKIFMLLILMFSKRDISPENVQKMNSFSDNLGKLVVTLSRN